MHWERWVNEKLIYILYISLLRLRQGICYLPTRRADGALVHEESEEKGLVATATAAHRAACCDSNAAEVAVKHETYEKY